jgi:hypothetical protein
MQVCHHPSFYHATRQRQKTSTGGRQVAAVSVEQTVAETGCARPSLFALVIYKGEGGPARSPGVRLLCRLATTTGDSDRPLPLDVGALVVPRQCADGDVGLGLQEGAADGTGTAEAQQAVADYESEMSGGKVLIIP